MDITTGESALKDEFVFLTGDQRVAPALTAKLGFVSHFPGKYVSLDD